MKKFEKLISKCVYKLLEEENEELIFLMMSHAGNLAECGIKESSITVIKEMKEHLRKELGIVKNEVSNNDIELIRMHKLAGIFSEKG